MIHPKVIGVKHRLLVVSEVVSSLSWNKHLPIPLIPKEKVIVDRKQINVNKGYVKVVHGPKGNKEVSVFSQQHFVDIKGAKL